MPTIENTAVKLKDNDGKASSGVLHTTHYDQNDRMVRAAVRLIALWAAAVATAFIPLAHFVLVPTCLIAGIVIAIRAYRTEKALSDARGRCPVCQEEVDILLEADDQIPKWTYCPKCNAPLQLLAADNPAVD